MSYPKNTGFIGNETTPQQAIEYATKTIEQKKRMFHWDLSVVISSSVLTIVLLRVAENTILQYKEMLLNSFERWLK